MRNIFSLLVCLLHCAYLHVCDLDNIRYTVPEIFQRGRADGFVKFWKKCIYFYVVNLYMNIKLIDKHMYNLYNYPSTYFSSVSAFFIALIFSIFFFLI